MLDRDGRNLDGAGDALERHVRDVLEAAAVQGLCHEGQVEAAVGVLRSLRPDLSAEQAATTVRRIAGKA